MHPEERPPAVSASAVDVSEQSLPSVLLHTASGYVVHGQQRIPVRLFLDSGSSLTFVSPRLIARIPECRPISAAVLGVTTFSAHHDLRSKRYKLQIESTDGSAHMAIDAYEYDFMVNPSPECSDRDRQIIERFALTHALADPTLLSSAATQPVSILVGRDQYFRIAQVGVEETLEGELVARGSRLGWIVGGSAGAADESHPRFLRAEVHCCVAGITRSARDLERLWQLEAIGIERDEPSPYTADEASAVRHFKDTVRYENNRYTVSMPRLPGIEGLHNNFKSAINRLRNKLRSLRPHSETYARYHQEIMSFVENGHAREIEDFPVDVEDSAVKNNGRYFMPHHNVITRTAQGEKWRIVFDCSSATRGNRSLNSFLLAGPNLNPDIIRLLLNFRLHAVAVTADVAKAYLCIGLAEEDQPLFQFLWQGPEDNRIRCYQMQKVTWGATPSGFLLASTLRQHFSKIDPDQSLSFGDSFYHDDFLRSFPTTKAAQQFVDTLRDHLSSAGMELAKWKTNSRTLAEYLNRRGVPEAALNLDAGKLLKVLGISWLPIEDTFQFDLQHVVDQLQTWVNSKRYVLKIVASVFDPLGWLSPYLIRGKLVLRELWSKALRWDDELEPELALKAKRWSDEIRSLSAFRAPRCFASRPLPCRERHLHVFGDASPLAYAAVAYLQTIYMDGSSETSIVMSKSRVAPRQPVSLPRLELMAAVLAARLRDFIVGHLAVPVVRVWFYTDSMVAYYWCTSPSAGRWKTFVANRVAEIQRSSNPTEWHHTPGSQNIVDIATRGTSAEELCGLSQWWQGPAWLNLPASERPITQPGHGSVSDFSPVQSEMRSQQVAALVVGSERVPVVSIERFSSLGRAVRSTEYVFRAIRLMRRRPVLDAAAARSEALFHLIRSTQREFFAQEVEAAAAGDDVARTSQLSGFSLFHDENGILRARTRLREGNLFTEDERNPIVIPGNSHLAELLITAEHRSNAHLGIPATLSALRRRYWITRARQRIKSILARCVACRRLRGRPLRIVEAPLPASRLGPVIPFQTTGLDFCGPFYTREKTSIAKSYIALFTCAAVRSVHLELVPSMSTPQTHLALRRFLSLYPECISLASDNARSLVRAATDIKRLFNTSKNQEVRSLLAERGLQWSFGCPRAPSMNGWIERIVGTVKTALRGTLGKSLLTFEELRTVICEISAVVNDRPLSHVSPNPDDWTPLTPAHFLRGAPRRSPLCTVVSLESLGQERLRREHLARTTYYSTLVKRWKREYITLLRTANMTAGRGSPTIKPGEVCLLQDDAQPRGKWTLVRILEAHVGRDGKVRSYNVKFPNGYVTRRAAQQLCPLEVASSEG